MVPISLSPYLPISLFPFSPSPQMGAGVEWSDADLEKIIDRTRGSADGLHLESVVKADQDATVCVLQKGG